MVLVLFAHCQCCILGCLETEHQALVEFGDISVNM